MKWPTAILLSVLAASLALATTQFAGCTSRVQAQREACIVSTVKADAVVPNQPAGSGPKYVIANPC